MPATGQNWPNPTGSLSADRLKDVNHPPQLDARQSRGPGKSAFSVSLGPISVKQVLVRPTGRLRPAEAAPVAIISEAAGTRSPQSDAWAGKSYRRRTKRCRLRTTVERVRSSIRRDTVPARGEGKTEMSRSAAAIISIFGLRSHLRFSAPISVTVEEVDWTDGAEATYSLRG